MRDLPEIQPPAVDGWVRDDDGKARANGEKVEVTQTRTFFFVPAKMYE